MIYHITTKTGWEKWVTHAYYESETLDQEGFIHCCATDAQVEGVLQRYFVGQKELILLHIDPTKLIAALKYELATNDELFPHIYGAINKEAISKMANIGD